jgi:hypothetical protein
MSDLESTPELTHSNKDGGVLPETTMVSGELSEMIIQLSTENSVMRRQLLSLQRTISVIRDKQQDNVLVQETLVDTMNSVKADIKGLGEKLHIVKRICDAFMTTEQQNVNSVNHESAILEASMGQMAGFLTSTSPWVNAELVWQDFIRAFGFLDVNTLGMFTNGTTFRTIIVQMRNMGINVGNVNLVVNYLRTTANFHGLHVSNMAIYASAAALVNTYIRHVNTQRQFLKANPHVSLDHADMFQTPNAAL